MPGRGHHHTRSARRSLLFGAALLTLLAGGGRTSTHVLSQGVVTFTHGVACGDPTEDGVVLWTRTDGAATLTPEIVDPQSGAVQRSLPTVQTGTDHDFTVKSLAS